MARKKSEKRMQGSMSMPVFFGALVLTGIVLVGGAIFIGMKDSGEINVTAAIQNSSQRVDAEGNVIPNPATTREDLRDLPNGGLIAQENQSTETPPQSEPEPEATSTPLGTEEETSAPEVSEETPVE